MKRSTLSIRVTDLTDRIVQAWVTLNPDLSGDAATIAHMIEGDVRLALMRERAIAKRRNKVNAAVGQADILIDGLIQPADTVRLIDSIKAFRNATGWGLGDAKRFIDAAMTGSPCRLTLGADVASELARSLRLYGFNASVESAPA